MRIVQITFLLLLILAQATLALDITTADGQTYKQCAVTRVEPDALRITHVDGAARIPYEKLPSALQKQYFDADKVATYRIQVAEARKVAEAKAAEEQRRRQQAAKIAEREAAEQQRQEEKQREEQRTAALKHKQEEIDIVKRQNAAKEASGIIIITAAIVVGLFIYFLPAIVGRHKSNATAIFVMNLFLGWSFIGWVVALIWACTKDSVRDS